MKHLSLLIIALLCTIGAIAQPWSGPVPGNIYYNQGNVGIGTTSPLGKFQVVGASDSNTQQGILQITTGTGANTDNKFVFGINDGNYAWINSFHPGTAANNLVLQPLGGNVGIGTTAPASPLTVTNNAFGWSGSGNFAHFGNGGDTRSLDIGQVWNGSQSYPYIQGQYNTATAWGLLLNPNGGNIGIGTTNPGAMLDVTGDIRATGGNTSYYTYMRGNYSQNNAFELGVSGHKLITTMDDYMFGGTLQLWTSDAPKVTILNNGNVGIGTTAPSNNLNVYTTTNTGGITITGGSGATNTSLILKNNGSGGNSWDISSTGGSHGYGDGKLLIGVGFSPMMTINGNGNVGIGTTSPSDKLEVVGSVRSNNGGFLVYSGTSFRAGFGDTGTYTGIWGDGNGTTISPNIAIKGGNVGIGSTSPFAKLQVGADPGFGTLHAATTGAIAITDANRALLEVQQSNSVRGVFQAVANTVGFGSQTAHDVNIYVNSTNVVSIKSGAPASSLYIQSNGNVGIGTTTPEAKLTVKGKIVASEIQVKEFGVIADYVFKPDYPLMSLDKVEDFVKQNQHLPEVPSEKEFKKDGMNVAEMNALLLKKVEELTLYLIDQNKQINQLKEENKTIRKMIAN